MPIVAVSMTEKDLNELKDLRSKGGFSNRSEVVRHALQSLLSEHRTLEGAEGAVTAVFTVLYSPKGKTSQCFDIQHQFNDLLSAMMHAHSNDGACVEVMVFKGDAGKARDLLRRLREQGRVARITVDVLEG